ncbi:hypothetical protein [Ruegeria sp. HKCCD6604]|uniref:YtkA-like domain-containing protein n=2 Tax=Roseobacteraceae TaxID=2854170 RepID=A0ABX1WD31_9RHOB|nr:hypothetical protein [Ruegeria sp. HKCCD6604]NOD31174.1 hypothetical protein [Ruegeria atlantica]
MIRCAVCFMIWSSTAFACDVIGQRMISEVQNAPEVYLSVDEIPLAQPFSVLVSICSETAVGQMRVDAIMPAHRHGMNYTPKVSALGGGAFRVDDMLFHMPGLWELQVGVDINGQSIFYTSEITLK